MAYHLEVAVNGSNFKRIDPKAYNITTREAWVKLSVGDQEKVTTRIPCPTFDPTWDETFVFDIKDPSVDKLTTTFYIGDQQIGQPSEYVLSGLFLKKLTYKGMAVIGGKVDFMLRALDFGPEEAAKDDDESDTFFDFLAD